MADVELITFIRKQRGTRISDDQTRMVLLENGWREQDINEAFREAGGAVRAGMNANVGTTEAASEEFVLREGEEDQESVSRDQKSEPRPQESKGNLKPWARGGNGNQNLEVGIQEQQNVQGSGRGITGRSRDQVQDNEGGGVMVEDNLPSNLSGQELQDNIVRNDLESSVQVEEKVSSSGNSAGGPHPNLPLKGEGTHGAGFDPNQRFGMMGIGELFSASFGILKKKWLKILGVQLLGSLVFVIPLIFAVFMMSGMVDSFGVTEINMDMDEQVAASSSDVAPGELFDGISMGISVLFILLGVLFLLGIIILPIWMQLALLRVVGDDMGVIEAYKQTWGKNLLRYLWLSILLSLLVFGGFVMFIVPGIIFAVWFGLAYWIFVYEGVGGMQALNRSRFYVRGHSWDVFLRWVVIVILSILVQMPIQMVSFISGVLDGMDIELGIAVGLIAAIVVFGSWLLSIVVGYLTLIYGYVMYQDLRSLKGEPSGEDLKTRWWQVVSMILGLLLPIIVIGAVVALSVINPFEQRRKAQDVGLQFAMSEAVSYVEREYAETGRFPEDLDGFGQGGSSYLDELYYEVTSDGQGYELCAERVSGDEVCVSETDQSELQDWMFGISRIDRQITDKMAREGFYGEMNERDRDSRRRSDLYALTNALYQYSVENNGNLPEGLPEGEANAVTLGIGVGNLDLSEFLVPTYIAEIPYDPLSGNVEDTGYTIFETERGRVIASASSELTEGWVSVER